MPARETLRHELAVRQRTPGIEPLGGCPGIILAAERRDRNRQPLLGAARMTLQQGEVGPDAPNEHGEQVRFGLSRCPPPAESAIPLPHHPRARQPVPPRPPPPAAPPPP